MSKLNVSNLFNENEDGAPAISGISTFSSPNYFVPPSGSTAQRPQNPSEGQFRFNTDSNHLEYYAQGYWVNVITNDNELGVSTFAAGISARGTGNRGLIAGGNAPALKDEIEYITISTLGNSTDFGNLTAAKTGNAGCSSRTRGIFANGASPDRGNVIDFVTFSSQGNAVDFGDTLDNGAYRAALSNSIRGVIAGGEQASPFATSNIIEYITIASNSSPSVDFGDLGPGVIRPAACASPVRGVFMGGGGPAVNTIQYITIPTTGNAQYFGDLVSASNIASAGLSNSTRGIAGAMRTPGYVNTMEFITIASTGNAIDFGDQTDNRGGSGSAASSTRGVFAGGYGSPTPRNTIDYVTILSTGNALDFGDLTYAADQVTGCSNGHGGL